MSQERRKELISQIEEKRGSRVLTYVTGDRPPAQAAIGDDAVRPLYDHLRGIGRADRLDVFIYSRGGAIDVPWRLATSFRQSSEEWSILVPFRANSSATLLALGADKIVLGRQGELGPIDPSMTLSRVVGDPAQNQGTVVQDTVSVEDVMAYVKFVTDRAGLSDQAALATSLTNLTERLDPVALGSAYRTHSHIRDVARRMLLSRKDPASEQTMASIIETLAERVYAHGHAIGLQEAKETGLPVEGADDDLDRLMWELLNEYEEDLKLRQPLDVLAALSAGDRYVEQVTLATIDSTWGTHSFTGTLEVQAKRQLPPTLNVALNVNLQLPPGLDVAQVPAEIQNLLAGLQQAVMQQAQLAVQEAIQQQAPLLGAEARVKGGMWQADTTSPEGGVAGH